MDKKQQVGTDSGLSLSRGGQLRGVMSKWLFETATFLGALFASLLLAPLILFIYLIVKVRFRSGPAFYCGVRLGRNKVPFQMYKFRTLPVDAQSQIGSDLFSNRFNMLTPLTNFMRETRLDELPQLLNVLKRDMDFFGPRPVRPEVYSHDCQEIPNYDRRFAVRPGLIGFSQLYTPHSSPKRIRSYIDNWYVVNGKGGLTGFNLLLVAVVALHRRLILRLQGVVRNSIQIHLRHCYREKRILERVQLQGAVAFLSCGDVTTSGPLLDLNESSLKVRCAKLPAGEQITIKLQIECRRAGKVKKKLAVCSGVVLREMLTEVDGRDSVYVIDYVAKSPLNHYRISQYFLRQSIA